jgi:biotin carboxyl carrier protein
MRAVLEVDGATHEVEFGAAGTVTVDGEPFEAALERNGSGVVVLVGVRRLHVRLGDGTADVEGTSLTWRIAELQGGDAAGGGGGGGGSARVRPPMNGKVERMLASIGQAVAKGEVLFVLEAMKMHNEVRSPVAGRVAAVHAATGDSVEPSKVLVEIEPAA